MRLTSNRLKFAYLVLWVLPLMVGGLVPSTAKGMYDPKHGRWLQRDPLGVRPDPPRGRIAPLAQYDRLYNDSSWPRTARAARSEAVYSDEVRQVAAGGDVRYGDGSYGRRLVKQRSQGFIRERGGLNLYAYVRNSPNVSLDPMGCSVVSNLASIADLYCLKKAYEAGRAIDEELSLTYNIITGADGAKQAEITWVVYRCPCCEYRLYPRAGEPAAWGFPDEKGSVQVPATEGRQSPPGLEKCCPVLFVIVHSQENGWPAQPANLPTGSEVDLVCNGAAGCGAARGIVSDELGRKTEVTCPYHGERAGENSQP